MSKRLSSARRLRRRYRVEAAFRASGVAAILLAGFILLGLLSSIIYNAAPAFTHTHVVLEVARDDVRRDESPNWNRLVRSALYDYFPQVKSRRTKRELRRLLSDGADDALAQQVQKLGNNLDATIRVSIPLSDDADLFAKGMIERTRDATMRPVSDAVIGYIDHLEAQGLLERRFAYAFFTSGDSREPERAGIKSAFIGTLWVMLVTLLISFPLGVMAAIYLQEIAPKNWFTDLIEVNINNLAAVPSIVFGLLGLAVFINFFGFSRGSPLVGGMVLALMTLPTIIIATRAALVAVPPSVREAALGIGASRLQMILHHILPLALPGILTGAIIGIAQAAGETAPLLMIGMMAFIVDVPGDVSAKATVLPAQIFMWANNPERAFVARTSAAIIVLLVLLLCMNALAIFLRKRFEKRW